MLFLIFAHMSWFWGCGFKVGVLDWVFWGQGFQLMGFGVCGVGPLKFFGVEALCINAEE